MADYGVVISIKDIPGSCKIDSYKDQILTTSISFSSSSTRLGKWTATPDKDRRISVTQSPVSATILSGRWVALLEDALFNTKNIGEVKITQLGQAVDAQATAKPTVLQTITLTDTVVTGVSQGWDNSDGPRLVGVTFEFSKILFEIGAKKADFTLRNFTTGAV